MGTFMGHALPGSFFISFSLWWTYNVFKRYYVCRKGVMEGDGGGGAGRYPYYNTATFPCSCTPRLPLEGILKVMVVIIGMTGEFVTAFENGRFTHIGNAQHMTMFFFFGLNGVVDILLHYGASLPHLLDYVTATLAFCMEGILFLYHLHGRTPMDVQVHILLVYVVGANIASTVLEAYHRKSVLPALARCYFSLLQGTWFFQAGFLLYPPIGRNWDEHDQEQMMIVTLIFCWHNAVVFVSMMVVGCLIHARVKKFSLTDTYQTLRPLTASSPAASAHITKLNSEQVRRMIDDVSEEEDV